MKITSNVGYSLMLILVVIILITAFILMSGCTEDSQPVKSTVILDDAFCTSDNSGFVGVNVEGVIIGSSSSHLDCYIVINKQSYNLITDYYSMDEYAYVRSLQKGRAYCFELTDWRTATPC